MEDLTKESLIQFINQKINEFDDSAELNWNSGSIATARNFEDKSSILEDLKIEIDKKFKD